MKEFHNTSRKRNKENLSKSCVENKKTDTKLGCAFSFGA
jgi:hypothetical protein